MLAKTDTVLITGANSGIGLEFAKQYAAKGWAVIATHRCDETPPTLKDLLDKYPNVRAERMDVTKRAEIHVLAAKLNSAPVDVLINNAGAVILGGEDGAWRGPGADVKGQNLSTLNCDEFDVFMKTNVAGPSMVTEEFLKTSKPASRRKSLQSVPRTGGSPASRCVAGRSGTA